MKNFTLRTLTVAMLAVALNSGQQAHAQELLIDTGAGNPTTGGAPVMFNDGVEFQFIGMRFSLDDDFTIGTIQAWLRPGTGALNVKLRQNSGTNVPAAEIFSETFNISFQANPTWISFAGLEWSQPAGTYWITFEPAPNGGGGSFPIGAPSPLPGYAFWVNDNPGWAAFSSSLGLRLITPPPPTPILVPGDYPTIQDAIDIATSGQIIEVEPGTYNEAINYLGKTIKIRKASEGRSRGKGEAVIDATGLNVPAVTIGAGSGPGTELDGFTIRGGSTLTGLGYGGGVLVGGSSVTVRNCIITENEAESGGGTAVYSSGNATFIDCVFSENTAVNGGGGAYVNDATITLAGCQIINNTAQDGAGLNVNFQATAVVEGTEFNSNFAASVGAGTAVFSSSQSATFTGCVFVDNIAGQGAGAYVSGATASFEGCAFLYNTATLASVASGGGIQAQGTTGSLTVNNCFFSYNHGENGGGIQLLSHTAPATITNCMFRDNFANIFAGGVHVRFSTATISDSVFLDNTASFGGGTYVTGGSTLNLDGSRYCGNSPEGVDGSFVDGGGNFLECFEPGDTNGDDTVNVTDLLNVIGAWGDCPAPPADCLADLNGDGVVNVTDLLTVIGNWG